MLKKNLGAIFTLSGTAIHASYVASGVFNGGLPTNYRLGIAATTIIGTNITSYKAKISASQDGVIYRDVNSQLDDLTLEVEHSFVIGAAGTVQEDFFTLPGTFPFWKVQLEAVGGAGQAGESLVVNAEAY